MVGTNIEADDCNGRLDWTMADMDGKIVKDLRTELKRHALKVKGLKAELQERLRSHFRDWHGL